MEFYFCNLKRDMKNMQQNNSSRENQFIFVKFFIMKLDVKEI